MSVKDIDVSKQNWKTNNNDWLNLEIILLSHLSIVCVRAFTAAFSRDILIA